MSNKELTRDDAMYGDQGRYIGPLYTVSLARLHDAFASSADVERLRKAALCVEARDGFSVIRGAHAGFYPSTRDKQGRERHWFYGFWFRAPNPEIELVLLFPHHRDTSYTDGTRTDQHTAMFVSNTRDNGERMKAVSLLAERFADAYTG